MKNINHVLNEIVTDVLTEAPIDLGLGGRSVGLPTKSRVSAPAVPQFNNPSVQHREIGNQADLDAQRWKGMEDSIRYRAPLVDQTHRTMVGNAVAKNIRDAEANEKLMADIATRKVSRDPYQAQANAEFVKNRISQIERAALDKATGKISNAAADQVHSQGILNQKADNVASQIHGGIGSINQNSGTQPASTGSTDFQNTMSHAGLAKMGFLNNKNTNTQPQTAPQQSDASQSGNASYWDNIRQSASELGDKITKGASEAGNYLGQQANSIGNWISANPGLAAGGLGAALAAGAGALYLRKKMRQRKAAAGMY